MPVSKWVQKLRKMDTCPVVPKPPVEILRCPSPSVNFAFANPNHGLKAGLSMFFFGKAKEGKSILTNFYIGYLHQSDPEAIVLKIDTEFKSDHQVTDEIAQQIYGIDPDRLVTWKTNAPEEIWDRISNEVKAMVQEGMPLRMIVIDSLSNSLGRREQANNSVAKYTIGDNAQTIGLGLKQIQSVIRPYHISLLCVVHARAEQDEWARKRTGVDFKANIAHQASHLIEYWVRVEKPQSQKGRADVFGKLMEDESLTTMSDRAEQTGVKVKVTVVENFMGPAGRTGTFSFDLKKGMVNQWEELAKLALNRNLVDKPNAQTYVLNGKKFNGSKAYYEGVRDDLGMQQWIWDELVKRDHEGPGENSQSVASEENEEEEENDDE